MPEQKKIIEKIDKFAVNSRKNILDMALAAGASSSHFGGALSIVDIISTLYVSQMNISKKDPCSKSRDRFILSKGHGCLAYYAALCEIGHLNKNELKSFEKNESDLLGHPVLNKKLGIDFSTGSLGMGLSLGIGVAISFKKKKLKNAVYVVLGDGECNEGSVWEAAMAASNFKLDNLQIIIDNNGYQQTGLNKEIMNTYSLTEKWKSFGWHTSEVDGHNTKKLFNYFEKNKNIKKPKALIAKTIKGKGFSFSENNNDWHHTVLTKNLYEKAMLEISKR